MLGYYPLRFTILGNFWRNESVETEVFSTDQHHRTLDVINKVEQS